MTFGEALEQMKLGSRIARTGWNGKGMWVAYQCGGTLEGIMRTGFDGRYVRPYTYMKCADDTIQIGWLASQSDMLADDWVVVLGEG
jgi:hypothetical protein